MPTSVPGRPLLMLSILAGLAAAGCASRERREPHQPVPDDHTLVVTKEGEALEGRSTWSMPIPVPGRSTVVVPFAIENRKGDGEFADPFMVGPARRDVSGRAPAAWRPMGAGQSQPGIADSYKVANETTILPSDFFNFSRTFAAEVRWHNAVVRDLASDFQIPVLNRRGVISGYSVLVPPPKPGPAKDDAPIPQPAEAVVFLVTTEDTSKDGTLNFEDAKYALVCDATGHHLRAVTPPHMHVRHFEYDPLRGEIVFDIAADADRNGRFDWSDPSSPWILNLRAGPADEAKPVVKPELREEVERAARAGR